MICVVLFNEKGYKSDNFVKISPTIYDNEYIFDLQHSFRIAPYVGASIFPHCGQV